MSTNARLLIRILSGKLSKFLSSPRFFFFFFVDDLSHFIHGFFFLEIFSGLLVFSPSFHGFVRVFCFLFCFGWNFSWVFDIDRKFEGV